MHYYESEFEVYKDQPSFDIQRINKTKQKDKEAIGIKKGFYARLRLDPWIDQSRPGHVDIVFELLPDLMNIKDTEYDNFLLRSKIYQRTKSLKFCMFIPYIAIN